MRGRSDADVGEAHSDDATRTGAGRLSAGDGAASRAFRRYAPGDGDRCGPRLWPPAPWESGRWRDEAQQGRRGAVHRFGAGFRPVSPRGELVLETRLASALALPRPRAAPASWLPAAAAPWRVEAPAGSRGPVGGVALASSRGGGRPRRAAVGASSASSSWPPPDGPYSQARPGVPRLRPCGLVTRLQSLLFTAVLFSAPGQLAAAAEAALPGFGGRWNPAGN